ncbi:hypothetical protein ACFWM7_19550 [Streptomyces sp. NPDC058375]|uniref:hypothetical protein n=1 Tax=Streptomyces sp. NPDC058375 TaxID=3346467 RepID=UPI0036542748
MTSSRRRNHPWDDVPAQRISACILDEVLWRQEAGLLTFKQSFHVARIAELVLEPPPRKGRGPTGRPVPSIRPETYRSLRKVLDIVIAGEYGTSLRQADAEPDRDRCRTYRREWLRYEEAYRQREKELDEDLQRRQRAQQDAAALLAEAGMTGDAHATEIAVLLLMRGKPIGVEELRRAVAAFEEAYERRRRRHLMAETTTAPDAMSVIFSLFG